MSELTKRYSIVLIYTALVLGTLLVYGQVRNFDFVNYDDTDYVYNNPHVLNGLTRDSITWAFTSGHASNWHPLTWLSLMLDCQLFGAKAAPMHLTNLFLHLANTVLLFAVLKRMTGSLWPSAFVAAAFAIHPMHVESVAWIAERKDVLSTLFLLLTLAAYTYYVNRPGPARYLLTLLMFALGLLSKPMLVTLPFLLLLLDYWPLNRLESQPAKTSGGKSRKPTAPSIDKSILYKRFIEKIPFFALSIISSVITFLVQRKGGAVADIKILPLQDRIANVFLSYVKYIGKMLWPENLAVFYPRDPKMPFGLIAVCVLLLLAITVFVIRLRQKHRYLSVGWFWFLGTLIPVIGLVQVGDQAYADRYTYISHIGLFIMAAWGLSELLTKWTSASSVESPQRKISLGLAMVIVLTAWGICAHRQIGYWKNSLSLFSHAVKATPNNYLAYGQLGLAFSDLGRSQDELEAYQQAVNIKSNFANSGMNLGIAYADLGRLQDAIEAYKQVIRIKPDDAEAYNNLGTAYIKLSQWPEAIEACKQAIKIRPDFAEAHFNLGIAYDNLGRLQEAIDTYTNAIRIKPDIAEVHNNLGIVYYKLGRYQQASDAYKQAIQLKPDYADAHNGLGVVYGSLGQYPQAMEAFRQVVKLKPDHAEAYNNLGAVYYKLGRFPEAIEAYRQAVKIRPDYAEARTNLGVACFVSGDKASAQKEYEILKTLDPRQANILLNMMSK